MIISVEYEKNVEKYRKEKCPESLLKMSIMSEK